MIIPIPSADCKTDWNYDNHGTDWGCRCSSGREQSPLNFDLGATYDNVFYNA